MYTPLQIADELYAHKQPGESFAVLDCVPCIGCNASDVSVWLITDSGWEYAGTALCAACLREMAARLVHLQQT